MTSRTRFVLVVIAVALVVAEIVLTLSLRSAYGTADTQRRRLTVARSSLRETRAELAARTRALRLTKRDIETRTAEQATALAELQAAERVVDTATRGLTAATNQSSAYNGQIRSLNACLDGARTAVVYANYGNTERAVVALRGAQSACTAALTSAGGDGPVFPFDFADPFLLRVGGTYFAYSTNAGAGNIQVIGSVDLRHWALLGNALTRLPGWAAPGSTWAPAVLARGGYFVAYYTARDAARGDQCISAAVSTTPQGPFVDRSREPLVCQHELGGSIDPSPFVDATGRAWLLWKSESFGGRRSAIWSRALRPDGLAFDGPGTRLLEADQRWEAGVIEAPALVTRDGGLTLFYSGSHWGGREYAIGAARCASPAGPCSKPRSAPVLASHDAVAGPGGAELFTSPTGELSMAYHAYSEPNVGYPASRLLRLGRVEIHGDAVTFAPP